MSSLPIPYVRKSSTPSTEEILHKPAPRTSFARRLSACRPYNPHLVTSSAWVDLIENLLFLLELVVHLGQILHLDSMCHHLKWIDFSGSEFA